MTMTIGGTSGLVFPDSSTQNTAATGFGFKNRIINGAMMIDQRNAGASGTGNAYTVDRWYYYGSQASKFTWQQNAGSVTPPAGFTNYFGFTSSSAYSVGAGDSFIFYQAIEGLNVGDLGWGTANAKTVTLSAWVRSSLTGTFGGAIENSGQTRSYPFTYTISSANTWTQISVTITGDTSGTWLTNNGVGMYVIFGLGVGSTFSGTAGTWAGANYNSATGATSVVGTNGATFYITGVQLERGSTASSFEYRPYGTELSLCQRYYQKFMGSQYQFAAMGGASNTTNVNYFKPFVVEMRTAPSFSYSGSFNADGTSYISLSLTQNYVNTLHSRIEATGSGLTAGQAYGLTYQSTNAYLQFSAEL